MYSDVELRLKKRNKTLFSRDSRCLAGLLELIEQQNRRTLVMWALDCAKITLREFETAYPEEKRPRACLELCEAWAGGKIKMPAARAAILASHAVAKQINNPVYSALCHAIGHAGATVHARNHAPGLPFYELTAIVLGHRADFHKPVTEKINFYLDRLLYWNEHTDKTAFEWASFLVDKSPRGQ